MMKGFTFNFNNILSVLMNILAPSQVAEASPVTLPEDLIGEILSLLTVKSLMRMKCVNKSWNTLISNPIFVKMHLKLSPRITNLILRSSCSADILPISVSDFLSWKTLTNDPYSRFHSKYLRCVGSCNGLICMLDSNYMTSDHPEYSFYFWNPATRTKSEKLGSIRPICHTNDVKFTFGYDNSTDTYKVVLLNLEKYNNLVRTTVKVFTLGDNVWRDIDCFPVALVDYYRNCLVQHDGVYFGNSIDWLVYHEYDCHLKNLSIKEYVIVSLDLETETYSKLLIPGCCNEIMPLYPNPSLFVFMDCLCFSYDFERTYLVIWQMKEFGVEESWTQLLKISYDLDLKIHITYLQNGIQLVPLCFSDDDALIFANNFKEDPIRYDWRNKRVRKIKITTFGDDAIRYDWYHAKEYYVESLVSTC